MSEIMESLLPDATAMELRQYRDGRETVVMAGREYGPPQYAFEVTTLNRNRVFNDGAPVSLGVHVRDMDTGELVAAFATVTGL